jgi:hypothetical protein
LTVFPCRVVISVDIKTAKADNIAVRADLNAEYLRDTKFIINKHH